MSCARPRRCSARYWHSDARYHRVLDRRNREPHTQQHRHRAAPAPLSTHVVHAVKICAVHGLRAHATCDIVASRCCDDTLTLVSWRARPRSFVALMALYESNYIRLGWLAGESARARQASTARSSRGDCDLVLRVTERCRLHDHPESHLSAARTGAAAGVSRHARAHLSRCAAGRGAGMGQHPQPAGPASVAHPRGA